MKILSIIAALFIAASSFAQTPVKREGNTFVQVKDQKSSAALTIYTYKVKDVEYPIYITNKGKAFIIRTSKNGKEYRQYLPDEVAQAILSENPSLKKE